MPILIIGCVIIQKINKGGVCLWRKLPGRVIELLQRKEAQYEKARLGPQLFQQAAQNYVGGVPMS